MTTLSTVSARQKLKVRREPHWEKMAQGNYLGFRKMSAASSCWLARSRDTETGKQRFKSLSDFSHLPANEQWRAAKDDAQNWFNHLDKGGLVTGLTVLAACERFIQNLIDTGHAGQATQYRQRFDNSVKPYAKFAGLQVAKMLPRDVQAWRAAFEKSTCLIGPRKGEVKSSSTINRDMAALRAALNHALRDGYVTTDHAWKRALESVTGATGQRDVYLTRQQRDALVSAATPQIQPFFMAACLLPVRPGALAKLLVCDFAKGTGTLRLDDKTGKRTIALPASTVAFFAAQCKSKLPTAPIFTNSTGKAWQKNTWRKPIKAAALATGLGDETVAYSLRHSTITDLVQGGVDLLTVAQLSGTSVAMIQAHYGHLTAKHGATALQILA
ncbi:MAG: tyrosine-type recombinase/integrase [Rhodoferax sp.]|jgi:integrase|nr:tyrosine-type recombinase/integrase [Rhodoferax sp.]